jgi:hypothetical protein
MHLGDATGFSPEVRCRCRVHEGEGSIPWQ